MLNVDQNTSGNENIALSIAYSSILSALIAISVTIDETLVLAHIELKSILMPISAIYCCPKTAPVAALPVLKIAGMGVFVQTLFILWIELNWISNAFI